MRANISVKRMPRSKKGRKKKDVPRKKHQLEQRPDSLVESPQNDAPAVAPSAAGSQPGESHDGDEHKDDRTTVCSTPEEPQATTVLEEKTGLSLEVTPLLKRAMVQRPGYGTLGDRIDLFANYFMLDFKDIDMYHYDIDIFRVRKKDSVGGKEKLTQEQAQSKKTYKKGSSLMKEGMTAKEASEKEISHVKHQQTRVSSIRLCREVVHQWINQQEFRRYTPCYDGQRNMYTTRPLPISKETKYLVTCWDEIDFEVWVQPVKKKGVHHNIIHFEPIREVLAGRSTDLPQEIIMALDTVMCQRFPPFQQVQVGRSFFMLNQRHDNIGEGLEIWYGYNQSVRMTERGPAVIVNFSAKAFHKAGSVIDYANELLNMDITRSLAMKVEDIKRLKDALTDVRVQVTHLRYPKKFRVKSVTFKAAKDIRFNCGGRQITVAQYFEEKYNRLKFPYLPCLERNETENYPIEVCKIIANQPKLSKLSGETTKSMIRKTAKPPEERFKEIERKVKEELHETSKESMNAFGLSMDLKPMRLPGRVLAAPRLVYSNDGTTKPDPCGRWRMDQTRLLKTRLKAQWILLNFSSSRERSLKSFASFLEEAARNVGMGLKPVVAIRSFQQTDSVRLALKEVKDMNVAFAVVVLSDSASKIQTYDEVKWFADIEFQLVTQKHIRDEVRSRHTCAKQ